MLAEEVFCVQRYTLPLDGSAAELPLRQVGVTTHCRLFPSVMVLHREAGRSPGGAEQQLGRVYGVIALHRVVADSVRMVTGGRGASAHSCASMSLLNDGDMGLLFTARLPPDWEAAATDSPSNRTCVAGGKGGMLEDQSSLELGLEEVEISLVSSDSHCVKEWAALLNYQLSKRGTESGSAAGVPC